MPLRSPFIKHVQDRSFNAGHQVDLIFALCQQGQRARALEVFRDLQTLSRLPAGIGELLDRLFAQSCDEATEGGARAISRATESSFDKKATFQAKTLYGWASNVNAAPKPGGIALGQAGALGYYTFAPSSRPQSSDFFEAGLNFSLAQLASEPTFLVGNPSHINVATFARGYGSINGFDTVFLSGQLVWPMRNDHTMQFHLSHWQLGGQGYETSWGITFENRQPHGLSWLTNGNGFWGASAQRTEILLDGRFDTNRLSLYLGSSQDALPSRFLANGIWTWSLGTSFEEPVSQRPGGYRLGLKAHGALQALNRLGQSGVSLTISVVKDQDAYNELLFGNLKRQSQQLELAAHHNFRRISHIQPFVGIHYSTMRDKIEVFTVEAMQIQVGMTTTW